MLLDQHNHYSKALGKCFVMIEWHYNDVISKTGSWNNIIKLYDVYQRDEYGDFFEYTDTSFQPQLKSEKTVYTCRVYGSDCKSIEEFNQLTRSLTA